MNSSKKGQKQIGKRSIDDMMVRIISKEKNNKQLFLVVYFHKHNYHSSWKILITMPRELRKTESLIFGTKKCEFSHEVFGGRDVW